MTDTTKQTITWTVILTLKHLYDRYNKTSNYMNSHIDDIDIDNNNNTNNNNKNAYL
jgi:hypothetical protein